MLIQKTSLFPFHLTLPPTTCWVITANDLFCVLPDHVRVCDHVRICMCVSTSETQCFCLFWLLGSPDSSLSKLQCDNAFDRPQMLSAGSKKNPLKCVQLHTDTLRRPVRSATPKRRCGYIASSKLYFSLKSSDD